MIPNANQDEQWDFHSRGDNHEDQTLLKEYLVSSYKKNLYPALKDEFREAPIRSESGVLPSRSKPKKRKKEKLYIPFSYIPGVLH